MRKIVRRMTAAKSPSEVWLDRIRAHVMSIFSCGAHSIHGPVHWQRVESFGLKIAERSGADVAVVRLFALLHDACRLDDGDDPEHGPRAAALLHRIVPSVFAIDPKRFELLEHAVRHHTSGLVSDDPTIGACWDADRLDIGRVGIAPDALYMSTAAGKEMTAPL
ncbi:MAG: HD domain-containing protein [Desulfobacterales bacterium]